MNSELVEERTALAVVIIVVVSALAYAGVSLVLRQTVDPLETGVFTAVFAAVYVLFAYYAETIEAMLPSG